MSEFDMPDNEIAKRLSPDARLSLIGQPTGFTAKEANRITQARLQYALSTLAEMNVARVHEWLGQVGERAPAEAVRLYLELLEFRMPRMKAAQVAVNINPGKTGEKQMQDMTIEELESVIGEQ